jgi:hypothetical protein
MKILKYLIIILLILCSCSPQTRFDRLIKRNPWLLTKDTLYVKDTIRDTIRITIPEVRVDTVVDYKTLFDTVYLKNDRIDVKVWADKDNKVYIQGKCDTVYIVKPYEKIVERKIPIMYYEKTPWYKKLLNNVIGILLSLLVVYITYRIIRNYLL